MLESGKPPNAETKLLTLTNIFLYYISEFLPRKQQWKGFGSLILPVFTVTGFLGPSESKGKPNLSGTAQTSLSSNAEKIKKTATKEIRG